MESPQGFLPFFRKLAPTLFLLGGSYLLQTILDIISKLRKRSMSQNLPQAVQRGATLLDRPPNNNPSEEPYAQLFHHAKALLHSYKENRSMETLEESIDLCKKSLSLCPMTAVGRDDILFYLAYAFKERYQIRGSSVDLQECIDLLQQLLDLRPPGHLSRDYSLIGLGIALSDRYARHGNVDDLKKTIELLTEALELCSPGHPTRDYSLINLGNALCHRYARHGCEDDLTRMIVLYTEALELCPPGHPQRDYSLITLGNALSHRYARHGSEDDLKKTTEFYTEALELCPPGHPQRDVSLITLGSALGDRYARHGNEDDLRRKIELYTESLELRPPGHPYRDISLNSLGNALWDRYARHGSEDDLRRRIELYIESVELCPPGHPTRDVSLNNLGNALWDRYARHGSEDDLKRSIELYTESLELCPPGHPTRDTYLNNLGNALWDRYARHGSEDDLQRRIELYTESLGLCPPGHPTRDISLSNLGSALWDRYALHGSADDLKRSIELYTESLELRPPGHPTRAYSLFYLGAALADRYNHYGRDEDLSKAFELLESEVNNVSSVEVGMLRCALQWVVLAEKSRHASLGRAFVKAVGCLRRYLSIGPTAELQYKAILQQTQLASLSADAAAYFIDRGDIELAVELLDEGRSLLWSEMRRFREPLSLTEKESIGEPLSARYHSVCKDIWDLSKMEVTFRDYSAPKPSGVAATSISYDVILMKKRAKIKEYNDLLIEIRCLPGCEDFQSPRRFVSLQASAKEGPIIIVNCSKRRSDAIIIFADRRPSLVSLEADFEQKMSAVRKMFLACFPKRNVLNSSRDDLDGENWTAERDEEERKQVQALSSVIEEVAGALWDQVVKKVVEELEKAGIQCGSRIWWCPTSYLTSLPLHAAGKADNFLADHYVSSYTPTLSALIDARRASAESFSSPQILLVTQTKSSGLEMAAEEVRRVKKLGSLVECFDEQEATKASVLAALRNGKHNWVHFTCHGIVSENPFESSLVLYKSKLSLNDIIKAHLPHAEFALLAACHSAELNHGKVLQDEVLHLAAGMQFSGFRSVIGTMWQMMDRDGPRLAEVIYREMLANEGGAGEKHTRAARALWTAVQMMRKKKIPMVRWANFVHIGA